MKGLLLKDFYIIRDGLLILLLSFAAVGAGLAFLISPWVLMVVAATTFSFQGAGTIQNDKTSQWERFCAVLPIRRSAVVSEKYALYLMLCAGGLLFGLLIGCAAAALGGAFDAAEIWMYACVALIVSLLPGSVNLPCAFLLSAEKSLVGVVLSYMATSALLAGAILLLRQVMDVSQHIYAVLGAGVALSAVCFGISWIISARRISARDV